MNEPRWLVVRNRLSRVLEFLELRPKADLHAAMEAERARRAADGWTVGDIPHFCSFCFCDRGNERICITVECFEPDAAPIGHDGSMIGRKR